MSAIFGETLTFGQEQGPELRLVAFGDEHYHRLETPAGFTVVYDAARGRYCYAELAGVRFVSTGEPADGPPPARLRRHLREPEATRQRLFFERYSARVAAADSELTLETLGPASGLLRGRRLDSGRVRGLTILVSFQDVDTTVSAADVDAMLNGEGYSAHGNACSVREYFSRMSGGKLDYTNRVVGPFTLSHPRPWYFQNLLVREALDLAVASGVDLRELDSRNEGIVDALTVLYAGQTQYQGELWPHNASLQLVHGAMRTSLYTLTSLGRTPADLSIGTFCHESGHMLCRFPDLYDYGNRDGDGVESAGLAYYCLMSSGNHLDDGRTPAPICAYLRHLAGWCDEVVDLNAGGRFEAAHGAYGTVMKYATGKPNEYFLVENRSKLGLDAHLPSSGLAVYHCDILGSNEWQEGSSTKHYQCALVQADGRLDLERNLNQGDGADLFGVATGVALGDATRPASRLWDGSDSGLVIAGVGAPGQKIAFAVGAPAPAVPVTRGEVAPALAIPDDDATGIASRIRLEGAGVVASLRIAAEIRHPYPGDLVVELVGPSGAVAMLHDRGGSGRDLVATWESATAPSLAPFVGLPAAGEWTLRVKDVAAQDVGTLVRWSVEVAGGGADVALRGTKGEAATIPDGDPAGIASTIALRHPGAVRHLLVEVDIRHGYIGDLRVELHSPRGRRATLHARLGGGRDDLVATYDSAAPGSPLAPFVGEPISGAWVLRVADLDRRDQGTLERWSIAAVPAE